MSENAIGDSGAEALGNALRVNTTLCGLYLGWNRVGPAGFASMATELAESESAVKFISQRTNPVFSAESRESDKRGVDENHSANSSAHPTFVASALQRRALETWNAKWSMKG